MKEILPGLAKGQYTIIEQPFEHGKDVFIGSYVHIRPGVVIGSDTEIRDSCWLGAGVRLGNHVKIMNMSQICSNSKIGNNVFIGPGVHFANARNFTSADLTAPIVEDEVRIGVRAVILPGVVLRKGCIIAAGSVVTKSTRNYKVYMGTPAEVREDLWVERYDDVKRGFEAV